MMQKGLNDTVFRVSPPNRFTPAYVMRWGKYKPDIQAYMTLGKMDGKFFLKDWVESPRYIFIYYTEGTGSPINRKDGKVKDYWAIYDKTAKTLTHPVSDKMTMREVNSPNFKYNKPMTALIENNIDLVGMPFWPEGLNHKGEMYMIFSKKDVKIYIDSGKFQKDKLQSLYDNLTDEGFYLMLVK
jgi:hypothetical protein